MTTVIRTSQLTGHTASMELDITDDEYSAWTSGTLIQDAFPRLSAEEREFVKTGITPEEWSELFGEIETV